MELGIRDKGDNASVQSVLSGASQHTDFLTSTGNSLNSSCNITRIARDHEFHTLKSAKLAAGVTDREARIAQLGILVTCQHLDKIVLEAPQPEIHQPLQLMMLVTVLRLRTDSPGWLL